MYDALRPMLAVSDGAMWLMSTPNGKRGFFYEVWEHGGAGWERVRATAEECARIPASFLAEERGRLGARLFRQEYLCEFEESAAGLFSREAIERAFTDEVEVLEI